MKTRPGLVELASGAGLGPPTSEGHDAALNVGPGLDRDDRLCQQPVSCSQLSHTSNSYPYMYQENVKYVCINIKSFLFSGVLVPRHFDHLILRDRLIWLVAQGLSVQGKEPASALES